MVHSLYFINDYMNGGAEQTRANGTWHLVVDAIAAAERLDEPQLARFLRELVYYFYRKGQSRLKRRIPQGYFNDIPSNWNRSLDDIFDSVSANYQTFAEKLDELPGQQPELFYRCRSDWPAGMI